MAYSCSFSYGEYLDFLDFQQKKFYNIDYWWLLVHPAFLLFGMPPELSMKRL